jgi:hypothetical protein
VHREPRHRRVRVEVGGLYEADDRAVELYPAYFLPWPVRSYEKAH